MSKRIYRVLSLDGGGMKGLFSAYFMQQFCQDAGIPPNELYKYFDIIAGTSIGGISALGYASGFSPDDMIQLFLEQQNPLNNGKDNESSIFYPPVSTVQKINTILYGDETWYSNTNLKALLNQKFDQNKMYQLKGNALITSVEVSTKNVSNVGEAVTAYRPVLFSNMNFPGLEGQDYLVQDVAACTSAVPIYFPAIKLPYTRVEDFKYIDGGVYQNNPAGLQYSLANALGTSSDRICVLSVGTGLGTIGLFDPIPIPPPKELEEFREFLKQKNYSPEKIEQTLKSIIPDFNNIYLLLDLISLGVGGPQEAINRQLQWLSYYGTKINNKDLFYYRFNTIYDPKEDTEMDNTSGEFLAYIKKAADAQYAADSIKIQAFIQKLNY